MDPIIAATHADPYPYYANLRAAGGFAFDQKLGLWVASSARAVAAVLAHSDCRVRPAHEPVPTALAQGEAGQVFARLMRMNDGEPHRCPRSAMAPALERVDTEQVSERLRARLITASAQGLHQAMFVGPVSVVAALLGFAPAEGRTLSQLTADFVAGLSPLSTAGQRVAAHQAAGQLKGYFLERLSAEAPPSPLLESLCRGLPDREVLLANLIGLLSQAYEASAGLIGNAVLALIREPQLRLEAGGVDEWVAEVQRFDPPVQNTRRFVSAPCEIEGVRLAPGDSVLLLLASANRDPQLNPEPERFVLERPARRSLSFGAGRHHCPGQALAMSIASATLRELLAHREHFGRLAWHYRPSLNGRIPLFSEK